MSAPRQSIGDTIYAVSSGFGRAAVTIIRISGPATEAILERLCERTEFIERRATLASIFGANRELLDRGIVIRFAPKRSFTGEAMAEFHVTGGRAVVRGVLDALRCIPSTRPADAGEFARRAYENEKLDLSEVEGLAMVVEAETRMQLRHAQGHASGAFRASCESARIPMIQAMAIVESMLDFSDVEDADDQTIRDNVLPVLGQAKHILVLLLESFVVSERLRDGMSVVIAGPPNVGKSTLLNALAKREVAIVSPLAGTTRDALDVALELDGYPITVTDTAGIRDTLDLIEKEGVARSRQRAQGADLVLWLFEDERNAGEPDVLVGPVLRVKTKADVMAAGSAIESGAVSIISARTGLGLGDLLSKIADFAKRHFEGAGTVAVATERQYIAVRDVVEELSGILSRPECAVELLAEDLRRAMFMMSRITGRVETEEILGEIFSRLCVGK